MGKSTLKTDDGLPIFDNSTDVTTDGLPILKKKENTPSTTAVQSSSNGASNQLSQQPLSKSVSTPSYLKSSSQLSSEEKEPLSLFKAFNGYQNGTLTGEDVSILNRHPIGKTLGTTGIQPTRYNQYASAHNIVSQKNKTDKETLDIVNGFYPSVAATKQYDPSFNPEENLNEFKKGDPKAIQVFRDKAITPLQKQLDGVNDLIQGEEMNASHSVAGNRGNDYLNNLYAQREQLTNSIEKVKNNLNEYGLSAITDKYLKQANGNYVGVDFNKIGEEYQKYFVGDQSKKQQLAQKSSNPQAEAAKQNIGYQNNQIGMNAVNQHLSNKTAEKLVKGLPTNDESLLEQSNNDIDILNGLDGMQSNLLKKYPSVGLNTASRYLGDFIYNDPELSKGFVNSKKAQAAVDKIKQQQPEVYNQYKPFFEHLIQNPVAITEGGFFAGVAKGSESLYADFANIFKSREDRAASDIARSSQANLTNVNQEYKIIYDKNGKAFREVPNENYSTFSWNNITSNIGQSLPGLAEWWAVSELTGGVASGLVGDIKAARVAQGFEKGIAPAADALKTSAAFKEWSGLAATGYINDYSKNYDYADELVKDDSTLGEFKKNVAANALTLGNIFAMKFLPLNESMQKAFQKSAGKELIELVDRKGLEGLTNEEIGNWWQTSALPRLEAITKATGANIAKAGEFSLAQVGNEKFRDFVTTALDPKAQTSSAQDNIKTFANSFFPALMLGIPEMAKSGFKNGSAKDILYHASQFPDEYIQEVNNELKAGNIDQKRANEVITTIKTLGEAYGKSNQNTGKDGLPLISRQNRDIVINNFRAAMAKGMEEVGHKIDAKAVANEVDVENKNVASQTYLTPVEETEHFKDIQSLNPDIKKVSDIDPTKEYNGYNYRGEQVKVKGADLLHELTQKVDLSEKPSQPIIYDINGNKSLVSVTEPFKTGAETNKDGVTVIEPAIKPSETVNVQMPSQVSKPNIISLKTNENEREEKRVEQTERGADKGRQLLAEPEAEKVGEPTGVTPKAGEAPVTKKVSGDRLKGKPIYTDYHSTIADREGKLLPFGEEIKERIDKGEPITIVTRSGAEGDVENENKILQSLGYDKKPENLTIKQGLSPEEKAAEAQKGGGVLVDNSSAVGEAAKDKADFVNANELNVEKEKAEAVNIKPDERGSAGNEPIPAEIKSDTDKATVEVEPATKIKSERRQKLAKDLSVLLGEKGINLEAIGDFIPSAKGKDYGERIIKDEGNVYHTLRRVKEKHPEYATLIDDLLANSDRKSLAVSVRLLNGEKEAQRAFYNSNTDKIYFDGNFEKMPRYVVHEAIHAMTALKIPEFFDSNHGAVYLNKLDKFSKENPKSPASELINIYKDAIKKAGVHDVLFGKNGLANNSKELSRLGGSDFMYDNYGFYNIHEFLAEAFTNPDFQKKLQNLQEGNRNIWDRFVDFVKNALGIKNKTALDDAINIGKKIISSERPNEKSEYGKHFASLPERNNIIQRFINNALKEGHGIDDIKGALEDNGITDMSPFNFELSEAPKKMSVGDTNYFTRDIDGEKVYYKQQGTEPAEIVTPEEYQKGVDIKDEYDALQDSIDAIDKSIDKGELTGKRLDNALANKERYKAEQGKLLGKEPPPLEPPVKTEAQVLPPAEEWTAVRKEKLLEIKGAKELFESETGNTWTSIQQSAMENLQSMYPDKNLYDASRERVNEFAYKYDNKTPFNPTAEDISVIRFFKAETERRMNDIEGWNSPDAMVRDNAMAKYEMYNQDLLNSAKALNPREAGTAFGMRQSEARLDPKYGLNIRRMEWAKAKGEPLNEAELEQSANIWAKEKELMQKEQQLREKGMQEAFDKEIDKLNKEWEAKLKKSEKEPATPKAKREKLLSQSGKELADKIRSGKLTGGTYATIPGFPQAVNLVIEAVAQIVEKGATLAESISEYAKRFNIDNEEQFKNSFLDIIENVDKRTNSLRKIEDLAKADNATTITNKMVSDNFIKDYVNSHIGDVEQKDILDTSLKGLQEVLPQLDKKKLIEAYLKEGDYKQEPKPKVESQLRTSERQLVSIAKLEEDIQDLNDLKKLRVRSEGKPEREKSDYEKELLDKKEDIINDRKEKKKQLDKEYMELETERNRQLKRVQELTEKRDNLKKGIREKSKGVEKKVDTPEIEKLKLEVAQAEKELGAAERKVRDLDKESDRKTAKITQLNIDIQRAKESGEYLRSSKNKPEREIDADIQKKQEALKRALNEAGVKVANEDKYTKASYDQRAQRHNDRIDALAKKIDDEIVKPDKTKEEIADLVKLRGQLNAATIKLDPQSKLYQKNVVENGLTVMKSIEKELSKKGSDFQRPVERIIEGFEKDKEESEQDIKLQRVKDKYKRDIEEYKRKLAAGEFEESEPVALKKTDVELIKLEKERRAVQGLYDLKKEEFEKANKSGRRRLAEFARAAYVAWLIGSPKTLLKVGGSALIRPNAEAITKLTFGKIFSAIAPTIASQAKLGGESSSAASVGKLYEAYLKQYGEKGLEKLYTEANDKLSKSDAEYQNFKAKVNIMDKRTSEYKDAEIKLQKLKDKRDKDLIAATGNYIYQFIAGSSIKEAGEVLLHRTATIENMFGEFDREAWTKYKDSPNKFQTTIDNMNYIFNIVGRSHAALKNFSSRASFAAGFIARLEGAVENGVDITNPNKIIEIANESHLDWDRGKYQQANIISDGWNKAVNAVDKISPVAAYIMRTDVAVTRVPVNILHEAIVEYTAGAFTSTIKAAREYYKAKGIVLKDGYTPKDGDVFKEKLREEIKKLDPEKAAAIARAFRKGGFGLGIYALAAIGGMQFGGFHHKGQTAEDKKKAKIEEETGTKQIKTGEVKFGDYELPEWASATLEHSSALYPAFLGASLRQVYLNNAEQGKSDATSVANDALQHVNTILNSIPQIQKVLYPMASEAVRSIAPKIGEWDDIDQNGVPIKRKAFEFQDYLNILPGWGDKKEVLSEAYYKQALSIKRGYESEITRVMNDGNLSDAEKSRQRKELLEQEQAQIDDIYKQNKENPQ